MHTCHNIYLYTVYEACRTIRNTKKPLLTIHSQIAPLKNQIAPLWGLCPTLGTTALKKMTKSKNKMHIFSYQFRPPASKCLWQKVMWKKHSQQRTSTNISMRMLLESISDHELSACRRGVFKGERLALKWNLKITISILTAWSSCSYCSSTSLHKRGIKLLGIACSMLDLMSSKIRELRSCNIQDYAVHLFRGSVQYQQSSTSDFPGATHYNPTFVQRLKPLPALIGWCCLAQGDIRRGSFYSDILKLSFYP